MNFRINGYIASVAILVSISSLLADDIKSDATVASSAAADPDISPFLLSSLEEKYSVEASKAEALASKAEAEAAKTKRIAAAARLKGYKDKLTEITRTGDFDKAQQVKARIKQLENEPESETVRPAKRPRPRDVIKFGGHAYALIKDPATWHVAKQRCEDMGGHLVCAETAEELIFIKKLAGDEVAWLGASDEEVEGQWKWVFKNKAVEIPFPIDNLAEVEHVLGISHGKLYDGDGGLRYSYICEWE